MTDGDEKRLTQYFICCTLFYILLKRGPHNEKEAQFVPRVCCDRFLFIHAFAPNRQTADRIPANPRQQNI